MPGNDIALLNGVAKRMHNLAARQRLVAQNVANSDTPGFRARDVSTPDFKDLLATTGGGRHPATVARPHVAPTAQMTALGTRGGGEMRVIPDSSATEVKPDGNNVVLEEQMLKLGQVQTEFASLTNLYRKQLGLLKRSVGSSNQ